MSGFGAALPRAGVRVQDRELDVMIVGVQIHEQLVDLVDDLLHARVGAVDLVHDQDHRQVPLERLAQDEARLRQRALARVHQQQHAVDHRQPAFDLAAEVGVAGRVHDVDLQAAVANGRVLREDRDALLALQVHGVHDADVHVLVLAERPGLPEHGVHERGLAVVDVSHDGDVADVFAEGHEQAAFDRESRCAAGRRRPSSVRGERRRSARAVELVTKMSWMLSTWRASALPGTAGLRRRPTSGAPHGSAAAIAVGTCCLVFGRVLADPRER